LLVLVLAESDLELKFIDTCHKDPPYSEVRTDSCQKQATVWSAQGSQKKFF